MAADMPSLFEDFQLVGCWWLPGDPQRVIHGTLSHTRGSRMRLRLTNPMRVPVVEPGTSMGSVLQTFKMVLGRTDTGEECTLLGVREVSSSALFPLDFGRTVLDVNLLFRGAHFDSEDDIRFATESVELTYLEDWVWRCPYTVNLLTEPKRAVVEIPREPTEVLKVRLSSKEAWLSATSGASWRDSVGREFSCRHVARIDVKPDSAQLYGWFNEVVRSFSGFLTLCVRKPVYPRRILCQPAVRVGGEDGSSALREVALYLNLGTFAAPEGESREFIPLPVSGIPDAPTAVDSWFSLQEKIGPVYGLLLGSYFNPHMYVEPEFLGLMQALEIFHRRLIGGNYLSEEEWAEPLEMLVGAIPESLAGPHRQALKTRLRYGNEYSLRKRLQELMGGLQEATVQRITRGEDNGFVERCVNTRNGLVHEGSGEILSGGLQALWRTSLTLRALLTVLILKSLGVPEVIALGAATDALP
ncbi:MAG TPA: HEPN domain-containing protein [Candidatus Dormibacteraeota bacterium]|nr:HEPN domain-containing protein [Candidatus Dormibacteraeota bacterium]